MQSKHSIIRLEVAKKNSFLTLKKLDNKNINFREFENEHFLIRIFFFGELDFKFSEDTTTIGSLEDLNSRGLFIKIHRETVSISNDWLGSVPIFFNRKNLCISTDYNFCVDEPEIDYLGLANYLKYGYSVFGITPIKNVEFLEYCSQISVDTSMVRISQLDDPVLKEIDRNNSNVDEVITKISKKLAHYTNDKEQVVIPLSGGYDSRFLSMLALESNAPEKILNVSYGYSTKQYTSFEVKIAREVSKRLGTHFNWIRLGNENHYIPQWLELKGSSTHLHGMYQMDFYNKLVPNLRDKIINISGIYGDLWAGKIKTITPLNSKEYEKLFLSHGLHYSEEIPMFNNSNFHLEERFLRDKDLLSSEYYRLVTIARNKMLLLSYLIDVPQYQGLQSYSPFLDFDVVSSILRLPKEVRENRKWQDELFKECNLFVELPFSIESRSNVLFIKSYKNFDFPKICSSFFPLEFKNRIIELNTILNEKSKWRLFTQFIITRYKLKKIPFLGDRLNQSLKDAIYDYYHLAPVESILKKNKY